MMKSTAIFVAALLACLIPLTASAQITPYFQDFESMALTDPGALAADGWFVFGNVDSAGVYRYGYGPFTAPNDGFGFCQLDTGQGGTEQGAQQLVVFSDYNNGDHANCFNIESNTYREWTVDSTNVGQVWRFSFQAKRGNIEGGSTAAAFIKTLDPGNGFALTNFNTIHTTNIDSTWGGYSMVFEIDASLVGQLFQIGFFNVATKFEGSGIFYDNIRFETIATSSTPNGIASGLALAQNAPNPFNSGTKIGFSLREPGTVDISVYDMLGRRVANLTRGEFPAGDHQVTWNGRTDAGVPAATGHYRYVLSTPRGHVSRSMVLFR